MKKISNPLISIFIFTLIFTSVSYSQIKYAQPEPRNVWSIGFSYSERGFGPSASFFLPTGKTTDVFINVLFSNVTDSREIERTDLFGNTYVANKINRVFMMPVSIGLRKEMFKDDIEGEFVPIFNIGVSPTLIFLNPYDRDFFSALGYTTTQFGIGGFTGLGVSFRQSQSMSLNFNLNYYYISVLGDDVQSLEGSTIKNVGGLQLGFAINFMK